MTLHLTARGNDQQTIFHDEPDRQHFLKLFGHEILNSADGEFEFGRHAFKRAIERNISDAEIQQTEAQARIIDDYPDDKYAPSSLLLGFTATGRPLHI